MKRLTLVLLIVLTLFVSIAAYAVLIDTVKIGGTFLQRTTGTQIVAAAATGLKAVNPWLGALTVGATLAYMLLQDDNENGVMLGLKPGVAPAPSGWSNANTPPSTVTANRIYNNAWNSSQYIYPTVAAACEGHAQGGRNAGLTYYACLSSNESTRQYTIQTSSGGGTSSYFANFQNICPAGYTLSGSTCNLSNSSLVKWPNDNKLYYEPQPDGGWAIHNRENDEPQFTNHPWADGQSAFTRTGPDEFGNLVQENVVSTETGTRFEQKIQVEDANGNTQTVIKTVEINENGDVTNFYQTTVNNTIADDIPPPSTQPVEVNIDLPTDYAREETQQQIRDSLQAETGTFTLGEAPTIPESMTRLWNGFIGPNSVYGRVTNLSFGSVGNGQCPIASFSLFGSGLVMDHHCNLYDSVKPTLQIVLHTIWLMMGVIIVLRA